MRPATPKFGSTKTRMFVAAILFAANALVVGTGVALAAGAVPATQETLSVRVDGSAWVATRILATPTNFAGKPVLNLTAFHDAAIPSRIGFNLFVPAANYIGTYALSQGDPLHASHGNYVANAGADSNLLEDSYTFVSGTLSIENHDAAGRRISGKFSRTVKNHSGKTLTISEGRFANVEIGVAKDAQ